MDYSGLHLISYYITISAVLNVIKKNGGITIKRNCERFLFYLLLELFIL